MDGRKICHPHHALRKQEAAACSSKSNGRFKECLRGFFIVEVRQQDEKCEGDSFSKDKIHSIKAKVTAMYSGKGDDFSRRMDAQILGVLGDMYGQQRVLPRCEEFVKRDQSVMVLDTRDVRC